MQATGKTLGAELPKIPGGANRVLYPASAKASDELQGSLIQSGYEVVRLNTYNTVCAVVTLCVCVLYASATICQEN